jgi:hypothetical protein
VSLEFPTLVFVHLGPSQCSHLWENLKRVTSIWPNLDIWVILDEPRNISKARKLGMKVFEYTVPNLGGKRIPLKKEFRNGFWHFSRVRLNALFAFHVAYPEKKLLHIESDVLLLRNFPFEFFAKVQNIAWMQISEGSDSAAIIFLPNIEKTHWLENMLEIEVTGNPETTDMKALWEIRSKYPLEVELLPIVTSNNSILKGVFDSAALGMWLTGEDPQNNFGITRRFINRFNIARLEHSRSPFDLRDNQLFLLGEPDLSVFNLHIHSKDKLLLSEKAEGHLEKLVSLEYQGLNRNSFSPVILLAIILDYAKRGKLLSLIGAIPVIQKKLKKIRTRYMN